MNPESYIKRHSFILSIILIIASFCALLYADSINRTFWYDEAYTIAMMRFSFSEIYQITAGDVHPPLYYFLLKAFCHLFGESLFVMRIFSNLGITACLLLGLFSIRRLFGNNISFTFILLMVLLPVTQYLGVEIRMYSWAMFFVLATAVSAYEAYLTGKLLYFSKMTVFAICAIYIHYYALVAVVVTFLLLWVYLFRKKESVVRLILFTLIVIIAFCPWIPIFVTQLEAVRHHFWVEPLTAKDMLLFVYYFFSPKEPSHPYMIFSLGTMSVALLCMLGIMAILTCCIIKKHLKKTDIKLQVAAGFIFIFLATLLITFILSFTVRPISMPRYTSCILGPLVLGISIYITELYKGKTRILIGSFIAILLILSTARFFSEKAYYNMKNYQQIAIETYIKTDREQIQNIIAPLQSYPALAELSILFPQKDFMLISTNNNISYLPFEIRIVDSIPDISKFYFVQSSNDTTHIDSNYEVMNKLELEKYNIHLLNRKK